MQVEWSRTLERGGRGRVSKGGCHGKNDMGMISMNFEGQNQRDLGKIGVCEIARESGRMTEQ